MTCYSRFSRFLDNGTRVSDLTLSEGPRLDLASGPQASIFGDSATVRQQLDQWTDATVTYIRDNRDLMIDALEAARGRDKSEPTNP